MTHRSPLLFLAFVACADEMPRDVQQATDPPRIVIDTVAPDTGPGAISITDMPGGGYATWIADIRAELPRVLEEAAEDRGEAMDVLQQLYIRRHRPLVQLYGEGGSQHAGDALASAVATLDQYFQELMRQVASPEAPMERLRETVTELERALAAVETAAAAAGIPPGSP